MSAPRAGPVPDGRFPRWVERLDLPDAALKPAPEFVCPVRGDRTIPLKAAHSLVDIATGEPTVHPSIFGLAWDSDALYARFDFVDPYRHATASEPGTHVYKSDTAAELFVAGPRGYYEVGVNSVGGSYEVGWNWVAPLVAAQDMEGIDRLFRLPNFLYYLPRSGERAGRVGDLDFMLPGLSHEEKWTDIAGHPGWTATLVLPWEGLCPLLGLAGSPTSGDRLAVQAMRANPARAGGEGCTWSVQGNHDVHNPERWPTVTLIAP